MVAGEHLAADGRVLQQGRGFEHTQVDGGLVVVELADQVIAAGDGGPAEERVGLQLHGALAFHRAAALVVRLARVAQVGRVGGVRLLLELQEERVGGAVALHVDDVVAQADGAGADDLERDVDRRVLGEEVAALGLQAFGVGGERVEHLAGGGAVDAGEVGRGGLEDAGFGFPSARAGLESGGCGAGRARCGGRDSEGIERVQRSGALGEAEDLRDRFDALQATDHEARQLQHGHAREDVHLGAVAG